jgi:transposase
MFPPEVEQWIGEDHPARFVRDLVESLDVDGLGFQVRAQEVGRPNYSARLLLVIWLYRYFNGDQKYSQIGVSLFE